VGDPRVEGGRRWEVCFVHYESEELCVHYRATIPREPARKVVVALLAAGCVPPTERLPGSVPRFGPLLRRHGIKHCEFERTYLAVFINARCLLGALTRPPGAPMVTAPIAIRGDCA
jgi:hypothetical protein